MIGPPRPPGSARWRVALDGMGSDTAPAPEVAGALGAVQAGAAERPFDVVVVGDQAAIEEEMDARGGVREGVEIRHAPDVFESHEPASQAVRRRKETSLRVAFDLLASGEVDAVVSAGHTGAVLALGMFALPRVPGVDRPALVAVLPVPGNPVVLLDVGANVGCRGPTLVRFAVMGAVYAESALGISRPRIGLLSNGEEEVKGDEATRAAHAALGGMDLGYVGAVEGRDLWNGSVDVAVCDGLAGNLLLKSAEGMAELLTAELRREVEADLRGRVGALLLRGAFARLRRRFDYRAHGGALLLGCSGPVVVAHGRSGEAAISSALRAAARAVEGRLVERIAARLAEVLPEVPG